MLLQSWPTFASAPLPKPRPKTLRDGLALFAKAKAKPSRSILLKVKWLCGRRWGPRGVRRAGAAGAGWGECDAEAGALCRSDPRARLKQVKSTDDSTAECTADVVQAFRRTPQIHTWLIDIDTDSQPGGGHFSPAHGWHIRRGLPQPALAARGGGSGDVVYGHGAARRGGGVREAAVRHRAVVQQAAARLHLCRQVKTRAASVWRRRITTAPRRARRHAWPPQLPPEPRTQQH